VSHEQISSVHLSSVAEDVCYAGGVDSEVVCRNVGAKGTPFFALQLFIYIIIFIPNNNYLVRLSAKQ
jgi:hypothetical protein